MPLLFSKHVMKKTAALGIGCVLLAGLALGWPAAANAQAMPNSIMGSWRIVRMLSTPNPECWDEAHYKSLVGSSLRYEQGSMIWKGGTVPVPEALTRTLSRRKFQDEYKVDLTSLGVRAESVTEVDLQHEDADITGATTEVPGDTVVVAGPGRIVVSACGVFFEAVRAGNRVPAR